MRRWSIAAVALTALTSLAVSCGVDTDTLVVYSGRNEDLITPLIERFERETGIDVTVRYGDSGELAATIVEEGSNSPADVFLAQDPASLGTVAASGLFATLPADLRSAVPDRFSDSAGRWVGISGRARVVVYDTTALDPTDFPPDEDGFIDPAWSGKLAIAPTNGSFLAFVAAKILIDGEDATFAWLNAMAANSAPAYSRNSVIVEAVDDGQVAAGLVNHYYLFRLLAEKEGVVAANHFLTGSGAGSLVMPSGAGIVARSDLPDESEDFVRFLLSAESQTFFAEQTFEYPLVAGVAAHPDLPPLGSLATPEINLSNLSTVLGLATDLVARAGLL